MYAQAKTQGFAQPIPALPSQTLKAGVDLALRPIGPFDVSLEPQQMSMATVMNSWMHHRYKTMECLDPGSKATARSKQIMATRRAAKARRAAEAQSSITAEPRSLCLGSIASFLANIKLGFRV